MNSTEDMVHHRSCLCVSACDILVCVTDAMFVCECMWGQDAGHRRNSVCVVVHAVWGDVSRVKCRESRV